MVASNDCFVNKTELSITIVDNYQQAGCDGLTNTNEDYESSNAVQTYGFLMNTHGALRAASRT